jgi:hypothetical protein
MRRTILMGTAALALAMVLAACQVAVGPGDGQTPTVDYTITAQTAYPPPPSPIRSINVPANQDVVVRVRTGTVPNVPTRLMVMEIEAQPGTRLEVLTAGRTLIGASTNRDFFASTVAAATSAVPLAARPEATTARAEGFSRDAVDVEPLAVATPWRCLGPCVAFRPAAGTGVDYFMVIRSPQSQQIALLAYLMEEQDQNEPNDTLADATFIAGSPIVADVSGAIERLGDQDYFRIANSGWGGASTLQLDIVVANAPAQLDIFVEFADGFRVYPGDAPRAAFPGEYFVVRAQQGQDGPLVAGTGFSSRYSVFIRPN